MVSVAATLSRRKPMTGRKLRLMTLSTSLLALPLRYGYVLRQPNDARGAPLTGLLIKPSLDDPCRALCIIDRAPKPRAALRERCNLPRSCNQYWKAYAIMKKLGRERAKSYDMPEPEMDLPDDEEPEDGPLFWRSDKH